MKTKYIQLEDKQWLENELKNKSIHLIAEEIGCSYSAITYTRNKFGIKQDGLKNKMRRISLTRSDNIKKALKKRYPKGRLGRDSSNWRGGRRVANKAGYIYIYKPDHPYATKGGNVMEHRIVLEQKIGRVLKQHEIAHHINGIKDDNRPENVELTVRGKHTKEHFEDSFEVKKIRDKIKVLELIIDGCNKCKKLYEEKCKKE